MGIFTGLHSCVLYNNDVKSIKNRILVRKNCHVLFAN